MIILLTSSPTSSKSKDNATEFSFAWMKENTVDLGYLGITYFIYKGEQVIVKVNKIIQLLILHQNPKGSSVLPTSPLPSKTNASPAKLTVINLAYLPLHSESYSKDSYWPPCHFPNLEGFPRLETNSSHETSHLCLTDV